MNPITDREDASLEKGLGYFIKGQPEKKFILVSTNTNFEGKVPLIPFSELESPTIPLVWVLPSELCEICVGF